MGKEKKTSTDGRTALPLTAIPGSIAFSGGTAGTGDEAYCYTFDSAGIVLTYSLSGVTQTIGCSLHAAVFYIENGGTLALKVGPTTSTSFTIPAAAVPDPTQCNQYVLVVTKQCSNAQTRVVATEEFRICRTCP